MPSLLASCRPVAPRRAAAAGAGAPARAPAASLHARRASCVLDVMLRGPLSSPFQRSAVLEPPQRQRRAPAGGARAGGGPRSADLVPCCDCQRRFRMYVSNVNWYKDKGLTPAMRCKHCRLYRQLAKTCGDDPDALFAVADSAKSYRELRNAYVESREAQAAALAAEKRATKEARITLAGGKTAFRREERRASTKRRRLALRAQRRADEAAGLAPPAAAKAKPPAAKAKPKAAAAKPAKPATVAKPRPPAAAPTAAAAAS